MKPETVVLGIHQAEPGTGITSAERDLYRKAGIQILVLPEYFWVRPADKNHRDVAGHFDQDM